MGGVGFQSFSRGSNQGIGTIGLNGCFAVVIEASGGAIVAHIYPTGIDSVLTSLKETYTRNLNDLAYATAFVSAPVMEDKKLAAVVKVATAVIVNFLKDELGLDTRAVPYNANEPTGAKEVDVACG